MTNTFRVSFTVTKMRHLAMNPFAEPSHEHVLINPGDGFYTGEGSLKLSEYCPPNTILDFGVWEVAKDDCPEVRICQQVN